MADAGGNGQGPPDPRAERGRAKHAAQVIANVVHLSSLVTEEDCAALVREIDRSETLMPLLDPSRFLREAEAVASSLEVARAFLEFRRKVEENRAGRRLRQGSRGG